MVGDYIIKSITVKDGYPKSIHREMEGAECFIVDLERGHCALLRCMLARYNEYHRIQTSPVIGFIVKEGESEVFIETENTMYHLVRNNLDDATFSGVSSYTYDVAKEAVSDYFSKMDEQYFAKYGTTKDAVLENDGVISYCASIHYNLVKEAGADYVWSCDFACSYGLPGAIASDTEY